MPLPTVEQAEAYFDQYNVPENIRRHCLRVKTVAVFLAQQLEAKRVPIDVEFVDRLARFHDLFKMVSIKEFGAGHHKDARLTEKQQQFWTEFRARYQGLYEGEVAYIIFKDQFPELALALKRVSNPHEDNLTWEELIVHYADWRVLQEKVVLVQERLQYLQQMYTRKQGTWEEYAQKVLGQERTIFANISFPPEKLAEMITNSEVHNHD